MNKVVQLRDGLPVRNDMEDSDLSAAPETKSPHFMQLYVGDYLADTRHLTTEQHGAYLLLLMSMWKCGGTLPNDGKKLARIAGVSPRRWHLIAVDVMEFFDVESGKITQKRLVKEYQKAVSKREKRISSGSLGGKAKALKTNNVTLASATAMLQHSSESELDKERKITPKPPFRGHERFQEFWDAYGHKVGLGAAEKAFDRAAKIEDPATIISAAREFSKSRSGAEPRFTPHPATWLNGKRWADAAPTKSSATIKGGRRGEMTSMGWIPDVE